MNALKNRVQLMGHLGAQPEVKQTGNGARMARLRVATNKTYTNARGERVTDTQWHNVVAWGKTAEMAEKQLHKGSEVVMEGKLVNRTYTTEQGEVRYITEVQATRIVPVHHRA